MRVYFLALATLLVVCVGCIRRTANPAEEQYHAPPAQMLAHPGPMVGGPGPTVLGMMAPPPGPAIAAPRRSSSSGQGMSIGWQVPTGFADPGSPRGPLQLPQAATTVKLSNIPGREGSPLYPSLHVYPAPTTDAYLSRAAVRLTDEDPTGSRPTTSSPGLPARHKFRNWRSPASKNSSPPASPGLDPSPKQIAAARSWPCSASQQISKCRSRSINRSRPPTSPSTDGRGTSSRRCRSAASPTAARPSPPP